MTMTLIETKTLGVAAATIDFTSIPSTFTDLLFLISARSTTTGTSVEPCLISFNSITSGFAAITIDGTGTTTASTTVTSRIAFNAPRAGTTANTFGNVSVYVLNYASSANKALTSESVTENNATEAHQNAIHTVWTNTAVISSVAFTATANNFAIGSSISLYGITKGSDGIVTTSP